MDTKNVFGQKKVVQEMKLWTKWFIVGLALRGYYKNMTEELFLINLKEKEQTMIVIPSLS